MNSRALLLLLFVSACGGIDDTLDDGGAGGGSPATGGGGGGSSACTDTWSGYGATFFSATCSTCHHHTGQYATQASVQAALSSIRSEISSGKMPEGMSLSTSERARILAYLGCGAP
ncbi:MAG: hypothetical protein ACOZQL_21215 [Myxococcota bacterium]